MTSTLSSYSSPEKALDKQSVDHRFKPWLRLVMFFVAKLPFTSVLSGIVTDNKEHVSTGCETYNKWSPVRTTRNVAET